VKKTTVYRGTKKHAGDMFAVGKEVVFWGFTSASGRMDSSDWFSNKEDGILFVIEGPILGYDLKDFSKFPKEDEILLEPENVLEITAARKDFFQCRWRYMSNVLTNLAPFRLSSKTEKALYERFSYRLDSRNLKLDDSFSSKDLSGILDLIADNKTTNNSISFVGKLRNSVVKKIGEALQTNLTLTKLDLSNCEIDDDEIKNLSEGLKTANVLRELDLSGNEIGDKGLICIDQMLEVNISLSLLNLRSNNFGIKGFQTLTESLKSNHRLTSLDLGGNRIGDEGAKLISGTLRNNSALTTLNLQRNEIDAEGVRIIAEELKTNNTLSTLVLRDNDIGDEGVEHLFDALEVNTVLNELDVECCHIRLEGARIISEAMERNLTPTSLNRME